MKQLKSFIAIIIIMLIAGLFGCSSNESAKKADTSEKVKTTEVKKDDKKLGALKEGKTQGQAVAAANQQNNPATNGQDTGAAKPAENSAPQVVQQSKPQTPANNAAGQQTRPSPPPAPAAVQSVKIMVVGLNGAAILNWTSVSIKENDTILDVLLAATGKNNIDVDYSGVGATAYVSGINGLYEREHGAMSGWICKQNGTGIPKSAGNIKVNAGDQIEWIYQED